MVGGWMIQALMLLQEAGADEYLEEVAEAEGEALLLAAVGIAVVFTALVLIGLFIMLLGRIFGDRPAKVVAPAQSAAHSMPVAEGVDPRTIAVLTAAAAAVVGRPVHVQRITFINRNTISAWGERGRVSIHASHNVRRSL